jgi:hypothetical protein
MIFSFEFAYQRLKLLKAGRYYRRVRNILGPQTKTTHRLHREDLLVEMNSIALALIGLNPPQPDQRRLRRHHGAAATSEARRFLLTSQTVWARQRAFFLG